jgi:hypothetical protein
MGDTHWNRPFKASVRRSYNGWFLAEGSSESNQTKAGYIRPPSYKLVLKWIVEAWE